LVNQNFQKMMKVAKTARDLSPSVKGQRTLPTRQNNYLGEWRPISGCRMNEGPSIFRRVRWGWVRQSSNLKMDSIRASTWGKQSRNEEEPWFHRMAGKASFVC
jgi:hypothetical protein